MGKKAGETPAPQKILFLGTGNAFNTDGRGSQSIWVEPHGGAPFLVDAGPTVLASMNRYGVDPQALERVFITHLHGDHIAGWPFLLLHSLFLARRTRPLQVFGPKGTRQRLETLAASCYDELVPNANLAFEIQYHELAVAETTGVDAGAGLHFDVVPLEHHPTSIGYRFSVAGKTIGVSGDTRWCPGLEKLAKGCDLLLLECTCLEKPDFAHVSLEEVRGGFDRLGAKRLALVHLSDDVARALAQQPIPDVVAAEDGMILTV
jgi:ribonuclease BN (tRNA processing enzyme)